MAERHPGLLGPGEYSNLDPASGPLKIKGVVPEPSTKAKYDVVIHLSRLLTSCEYDALEDAEPIRTHAGMLYRGGDRNQVKMDQLKLIDTTIEQVKDNKQHLIDTVTRIGEVGESLRNERIASVEALRQEKDAQSAEIQRRKQIANEIAFDE